MSYLRGHLKMPFGGLLSLPLTTGGDEPLEIETEQVQNQCSPHRRG